MGAQDVVSETGVFYDSDLGRFLISMYAIYYSNVPARVLLRILILRLNTLEISDLITRAV